MSTPGDSAGATPSPSEILHASCVAHEGRGALIVGRSGSGKSGLALQMMALGATLVSDDRTVVSVENGELMASAPDNISGMIEARGVGILRAVPSGPVALAFVVDMERPETDRLPEARGIELLGRSMPLLGVVSAPHFPSALLQMLACGRQSP